MVRLATFKIKTILLTAVALLTVSWLPWAYSAASGAPFPQNLSVVEFPSWIKNHLAGLAWKTQTGEFKLNRKILQQSLVLGRQFMINNQKPQGNFNYQYDFVKKKMDKTDRQVRHAGSLWELALMYQYDLGLYKLTGWQVGGPLQAKNPFLIANRTNDPLAIGGIMNHRKRAPLRIDVTQYQMHAVILALKIVYTK